MFGHLEDVWGWSRRLLGKRIWGETLICLISISLQWSPGGQILFLIWKFKSWPLKTYMKTYWIVPSKSVSGQPTGSASRSFQLAWYYFWNENWNPDPYKPIFKHTWRHIGELPLYLYLASLQYQPPAASRWPDIIFDMRIEILALTNLHLDIHEGISEFDLCIWSAYRISLQDQPPAASRWPKTIFDMRIEILTLTNLHLDIHEGILESYLYTLPGQPPVSASSGL